MAGSQLTDRVMSVRRSARRRMIIARTPRYLFAAFLAVTSIVGIREIVAPREDPTPAPALVAADHEVEAFALELARSYLSYDAARPQRRERQLRALLPADLEPDAGLVPRGGGSRQVLWAAVASVRESADGTDVVTVAAQTDTTPGPIYLAVAVGRTRGGEMRLTAYPALVGAPAVSDAELPERPEVEDRELVAVARRVVGNYLAGESANLAADLLPGARVSLPALRLRVRSVLELAWTGVPESGSVLVTVEASAPGGDLFTLSYELGIAERRGRPYVSFIETESAKPPRRPE